MSEPEINNGSTADTEPSGMQQTSVSPGAQLAAFRQERGLTVEQVASRLNLAPRQIVAIESDNYPALPGIPIVRGFIRAYAKLLKVNAAPLLVTLNEETVVAHEPLALRKTLAEPFAESSRLSSTADHPGGASKLMIGGLLVLLLGVAIWAAQKNADVVDLQRSASKQLKDGLAYLSGSEQNVQKPVPAVAQATSQAAVPVAAEKSNPEPQSGTQTAATAMSTPVAEEKTVASVANPPVAEKTVAAIGAEPVFEPSVPSGKDMLSLKARSDSWVEVRRVANNKILLSRIMKAGEAENIEITEPVSLVVGNVAGVEAALRGEPVELKVDSSNVARLNLK